MSALAPGLQQDRRFAGLLAFLLAAAVGFTVFPAGLNWPAEDAANVEADDITGAPGEGSLARKLQWMPLFAIAGLVLLYRARLAVLVALRSNPFLWLFLLWCTASVLWSAYPGSTLKKVIQLYGVAAMALAFQCASWRPARFADIVRATSSWIILLSIPFALLFPDIGIHHGGDTDGKWKGLTNNKNTLGLMAAFTLFLWLHAYFAGRARLRTTAFWCLLSVVVMVLAQSATAFGIAAICGPLVVLLLRTPPDWRRLVLPTALAVAALVALGWLVMAMIVGSPSFVDVFAPIAALFGKDITLTGRTDIWVMTLEEAARHPLHGIGYGAFWLGPESRAGWIIEALYWVPWQGHNAYIDLYNETGLVGLALVAGFLLWHFRQLQRLRQVDRSSWAVHATLFVYFLLTNVVETELFRTITIQTVLVTMSSMDVTRALFEVELRGAVLGPGLTGRAVRA